VAVLLAGENQRRDEIVALAVPPDLRNGRAFVQSNLWVDGSRRYAVWVLPDGGAHAGMLAGDGSPWQITDLASVPGNPLSLPTEDDNHNAYVIATDADGYVHVMGNMHTNELRYARTTKPHDLSTLAAATIDGAEGRVTYPQLVGLPDGTLLFFRRHGVPGDGETRLSRLPPGAEAWEPAGTILDGRSGGESPYLHDVAVDPATGTIHLLVTWRGMRSAATTNDLTYARSRDGGITYETSEGEPLALPITHSSIEMVVDTAARGSGLVNNGGFAVDGNGHPHGVLLWRRSAGPEHVWIHHDGRRWRQEPLDGTAIVGRPEVIAAGAGIWVLGASGGNVTIEAIGDTGGGGPRPLVGPVPAGWEPVADSNGLSDGVLELLMPEGADPAIFRLRVEELS
jgi:hypothetical protein